MSRVLVVSIIFALLPMTLSVSPQHFPTQLFITSGPVEVAGSCAGGRGYCLGGFDAGEECATLGANCAGDCAGGTWIVTKVSCTGATAYCECSNTGVPSCVNGVGVSGQIDCKCTSPNTKGRCLSNSDCTGGGACANYGLCKTVT